jgi:hypothetical protein
MIMKFVALLFVGILAISCASEQKKISRAPTAELKLRRQQLIEEIEQPQSWRFTGFRAGTQDRGDEIAEKEKIEFELLRRWQEGDREAYLPQFSR